MKDWITFNEKGRFASNPKSLVGQRFNRLLVTGRAPNRYGQVAWETVCDCGTTRVKTGQSLRRGVMSCGCFVSEIAAAAASKRSKRHGMTGSSTYAIWSGMLARCGNPKSKDYQHYGGRGISICDRWKLFDNFLADMGVRPAGMSIDRIDNDGDYEPNNCRWATIVEQNRNTRTTVYLTLGGVTKCYAEWAEIAGMSRKALRGRINRGWSPELAISTPIDRRFSHA